MSDFESTQNVEPKKHNMPGWWEERTLGQKIVMGVGFGILGLGFLALCGWVVMLLWNWLMPVIFGLKTLTYWQAWGLLLLTSILFKGPGRGGSPMHSENKRKRKLKSYIQDVESQKQGSID
jgi:hypothetical protein